MPRASPMLTQFNAGEWSPLMEGRVDLEKYSTAARRMRRFIPTAQGPAFKMPGTLHVANQRFGTPDIAGGENQGLWLVPFVFNRTQGFVLQFFQGDYYPAGATRYLGVRIFTDHGLLTDATLTITAIADNGGDIEVTTSGAHSLAVDDAILFTGGTIPSSANKSYGQLTVKTIVSATKFTIGTTYDATWTATTVAKVIEARYALTNSDIVFENDDDSFAFDYVQSGDVLYLAHPDHTPLKLTRVSNTNWTLTVFQPDTGPFMDENATTTTITTTTGGTFAVGQTVTLTASANLFAGTDVNRLVRLEPKTITVKKWEAAKSITINDFRISESKVYKAGNTATTGGVKPVHEEGTQNDGNTGVDWAFQHALNGVVRITGYTSPTVVTATVITELPADLTTATPIWRLGAWDNGVEYPRHVCFFRNRLAWAGEQRIWLSVAGGYDDYSLDTFGQVLADNAITAEVQAGQTENIKFIAPTAAGLVIGTASDELVLKEATTAEPLGPDNVNIVVQSSEGCREMRPVTVSNSVLFSQLSGRALREARYSFESDSVESLDRSILAEHITYPGLVQIAWQRIPYRILWGVTSDGGLVGFTFDRDNDVVGWHKHPFADGYTVNSIAVIPDPTGTRDELWLSMTTPLSDGTIGSIGYLTKEYRRDDGDDRRDMVYLDLALTYDGTVDTTLTLGAGYDTAGTTGVTATSTGAFVSTDVGRYIMHFYTDADDVERVALAEITGYTNANTVTVTIDSAFPDNSISQIDDQYWQLSATTVTGLYHLEGKTVSICLDGATHADKTVSGGSVTLDAPGGIVHVGLRYTSTLQTMRIEAGGGDGPAQGKTKRIHRVAFRLLDSIGGEYGPNETDTDEFQYRDGNDPMDIAPPLFSGDIEVAWPSGYETDGYVTIVHDAPQPFMVQAIMPRLSTQDR